MVLAQKQTHRSMEQNREPRNGPSTLRSTRSLYKLASSKGDIIMIFAPAPLDLRADMNDEEQALKMVSMLLGYEGKFQLIAESVPFEIRANMVHSVQIAQSHTTYKSPSYFQNLVPNSTAELPMVDRKREKFHCRKEGQDCSGGGALLSESSSLVPEHFSGHLILHPYFSVMALWLDEQIYSMEKSKFPPKIKMETMVLPKNKEVTSKPLLFSCTPPPDITLNHMKPSISNIAKEHFLMLMKVVISAEIQGKLCKDEVLKCQNIATKATVKLPLFVEDLLELADDAGAGKLLDLWKVRTIPCHIRQLRAENVIIKHCLIAKDTAVSEDISSDFSEDICSDLSEDAFEIYIE
ncbi:unnamed protein product [Nyctereutes procyonoides]|uniref:(raccoon dog) hypothetical protein n=1 Tax=Nyctereutes procyonoides TaxID=34880 RepID=A0A811YBU6_NYCPR|nr:unnamed protein product [Nyctereutes procyonoides]